MIAACPRCSARYRVDRERIGPEGARLRCARCEAVFRVRVPSADASSVAQSAEAGSVAQPAEPRSAPAVDRGRLVVVADRDAELGKRTASALAQWGVQPVLVHDGVEALLSIQRMLPKLVILDAALPKMYGFQICEVLKRNESLREIRVVLIGAIHDEGRYRRPPTDLYGADAYLERPDLPDGLKPILEGFGFALSRPEAAAPRAPQGPASEAVQHGAPAAPAAAGSEGTGCDPALAEARENAQRLARIIVSDVVLYNQDKFDEALRSGSVIEALASGLAEAREFFRQKVEPAVLEEKDYLVEELMRVARERGMGPA